jgi:hypothetical protein
MKILFINSLEPNQGDFYFLGMKKLFGHKNVIEYPYKPLYHCYTSNGVLIAKDLQGNIIAKENKEYGTMKYNLVKYPVPRIFCLLDSGKYQIQGFPDLADYDLIICNFLREKTPLILKRILSYNSADIPPIVFIDGEDDFYIRNLYRRKHIIKYFKREILTKLPENWGWYLVNSVKRYFLKTMNNLSNPYYLDFNRIIYIAYGHLAKINPLNLTIPDYGFRPNYNDKVYDISFIANATSPLRVKIYYKLLEISKRYRLKSFLYLGKEFSFGIPWIKYIEIISKSKLSVSIPGGGFDTYRYWEIPYHGTALVSWEPWIKIPDNFINGESAIFFRKISEVEKIILDYLKSDRWEVLAKNGREHFLRSHTPEKRIHYIFSALKI